MLFGSEEDFDWFMNGTIIDRERLLNVRARYGSLIWDR